MEYILLLIIILQFAYIVYKDRTFDIERERMQLKIMSNSTREYKDAVEDTVEEPVEEEEQFLFPAEDVPVEEMLKAVDRT
jgi:hypothetical protein